MKSFIMLLDGTFYTIWAIGHAFVIDSNGLSMILRGYSVSRFGVVVKLVSDLVK